MQTTNDAVWKAGRLLHSEYRSVINAITSMVLHEDYGARRGLIELDLRDRFMTIDQQNYIYHQGEIRHFKAKDCAKCRYETPEIPCQQTEAEVEKCYQIAEDRKWADRAAPIHTYILEWD